jgi:hypothetical protein
MIDDEVHTQEECADIMMRKKFPSITTVLQVIVYAVDLNMLCRLDCLCGIGGVTSSRV